MKAIKSIFFLLLFNVITLVHAQPPGSLDPSFGTAGKVTTSFSSGQDRAYGAVQQTDGKIVVAGYISSPITGKDFLCARYNEDGSLDTTFGTGGSVTADIQLGSEDIAYDLALQTDGKIVVVGSSDDGSNMDGALIRLNTDGSLDTTFGTGGIVTSDYDTLKQDELKTVAIHLLTGNIVVGGAAIISSSSSKGVLARYLPDGTPDSTFSGIGHRTLWVTSLDYQYLWAVEDLVVQPSGKISAVGWRDFPALSWDSDYWVLRANSDGTMDATFSTDGVATYNGTFNGHDRAYSMILQPDNDMVVAGGGYISDIDYDFSVFEVTSSGPVGSISSTHDFTSFSSNDYIYRIDEDSDGNYALIGSEGTASARSFAVGRISSTGSDDASFDGDGYTTTTFDGNDMNEAFDGFVQPDNKIVAVGHSGNSIALARYLGEGVPVLDEFVQTAPSNGATNQNYLSLTCSWTTAYGATEYQMVIDTSSDFTISPDTFLVTSTSNVLSSLEPETQYWWKVRASDGTSFGSWTATWDFVTKAEPVIGIQGFEEAGVSLFPNPANNEIMVRGLQDFRQSSWEVLDFTGKSIRRGTIQSNDLKIEVSDLPEGIYFLRINGPEGLFGKFVKL